MTDEQMEKARAALHDAKMKALEKRVKLRIYRNDQKQAERLQLPFRMIHRHEYPDGEIPPNDYYPHLSRIGRDEQGNPYTIPDAVQVTPEQARHYFTRLLSWNQANLSAYRLSDWTGEAITKQEAERLYTGYMERIRDYTEHPERYSTEGYPMPADASKRYFLPEKIL